MSEKSEAIANADAHLQNVGLPTFTETVNALRQLYGTKCPFAAAAHGGLGLPYTSENLREAAWRERDANADAAAVSVLQKALGIHPVSVTG
ncbi:hypothetical protein ACPCHQ_22120 [Ralstonia thomasii]|uniref:hypothetical protein n=1 Tax=Ralstonia thomasii TaxID=3058596 RepID=UPI003C2CFCAE